MDTITLPCYGGKQGTKTFRKPANVQEMIAHFENHRGWFWLITNAGDAKQVRRNGAIKRWKRDPNRVEIPVKYGLYEHVRLDASYLDRVLIEVTTANTSLAPTLATTHESGLSPALGGV